MNESARPAQHDDIDILVLLAEAVREEKIDDRGGSVLFDREAPQPPHDQRFAQALDDPRCFVFVGTIDDVVVGYATMTIETLPEGRPLGRIDELYVLPGARGIGIGEALMDALVATASEQGCRGLDALALPGDRSTKNFFETFGLKARAIVVHRSLD